MPKISVELDLGSGRRADLEVVMGDVRRMLVECFADAERQGLFFDEPAAPAPTLHAFGCACQGCLAIRAYNTTQGMN